MMAADVLNPKVKEAIFEAVRERDQPIEVAKRIEAWVTQIANGNVGLEKPDDYESHLEHALSAVRLVDTQNNGGDNDLDRDE
jgi:hypothetical protein